MRKEKCIESFPAAMIELVDEKNEVQYPIISIMIILIKEGKRIITESTIIIIIVIIIYAP